MKRRLQKQRSTFLFLLIVVGALTLLTSCGGGQPAASWFGITVDREKEIVYLAANEQILALDLESGAELWAFPSEPDSERGPFYATPLLKDGLLVVGDFSDGQLYALSQEDGAQEWIVETDSSIVAGATTTDGGIIVGNGAGQVFLVETETREKRQLLQADDAIWAVPLIEGGQDQLYVASMDHSLYALDLASGERLWKFEAGGAVAGTPALSEGVLYFGALNNTFFAVDAETGAKLWDFTTDGWVWGAPLVHQGTVYFGDMAGNLYALDAAGGSERWAFEAEGGVRVTPVLDGDLLYFGTRQKRVYAIRVEDGTQQWALSLAGAIYSQPKVVDDYLLISPHNAQVRLVALDTESGAERWAYPRREE